MQHNTANRKMRLMLIELTNTPRDYAWGSLHGISTFTGAPASGEPEAELWFGTHPGSPTSTPSIAPGVHSPHATLAEWLAVQPALLDGTSGSGLPILLKVLAADRPLSLQVHPTDEQARIGFAAENARGIPLDHPSRNYKDPYSKPEIIVAVTDFDALCGFRTAGEVAELTQRIESLADDDEHEALAPLLAALSVPTSIDVAMRWLLSSDPLVPRAIDAVISIARKPEAEFGSCAPDFSTIVELADHYPGDPGILIAALMNRVALLPGECLFAPAGMLHAYLKGVGIELMTASDNVVRGGMTGKHIDVDELLALLSFAQAPAQRYEPKKQRPDIAVYAPPAPFTLTVIDVASAPVNLNLAGPSIILVEDGLLSLEGKSAVSILIGKGSAFFAPVSESPLTFSGAGRVWVATSARGA